MSKLISFLIVTAFLFVMTTDVGRMQEQAADEVSDHKAEGLSIKPERTIAFDTTEGTYMNVDVSPDGKTIVFDLLGDIYTVSIAGGNATRLTSGMAYDIQPTFSPDGRRIAYVSDRSGSDNIWVMDADGQNQRALTKERDKAVGGPRWSPDGDYVLARRDGRMWLYHKDGGDGLELTKDAEARRAFGGVFAPDGRYVYFSSRGGGETLGGRGDLTGVTSWQIRRLDRQTGDVATITGSPNGAFRPAISRDGRWLAYGCRVDAKTGLRLRNLETDQDDWLLYPIDRDNAEGAGTLDLMPAYSFTPDGDAIILATGGTFHRVELQSRRDQPIAFKAHVDQQLGPFVYFPVMVTDNAVSIRNVRCANANPTNTMVVFSAAEKIWAMDLPSGKPQPVVEQSAGQYLPVLSPDGRWVAYVTWNDVEGGHVWKVPAGGGTPERLTPVAAFYLHPAWSPDGAKIAFLKEDAAAARNVWSRNTGQVQWVASSGGPVSSVASAPSDSRISFSQDSTRLIFVAKLSMPPPAPGGEEERTPTAEVVSVRLDGTDRRAITKINAETFEAVPSPDGKWIAFSVREDVYLAALPLASDAPTIGEKKGPGPVKRVTREGGIDLRWADGGRTLTWVFANRFYRLDRDKALAAGDAAKPEAFTLEVSLPRHHPTGAVALKGADVITMRGDEVLQNATVLVKDNRITAVGKNVPIPAGTKVIDITGKTIMPGLIDMHAHLRQPRDVFVQSNWSYLANLAYGVTTARDVSTSNDQFAYAEMIETGAILGPRIISAGRAMTRGNAKIETLEDARSIVRHYKQLGTTFIKQYMQPHRRQRQWVLQAAREEGLNATNEGGGDFRLDMTMVLDGYTGWEHALPLANIYGDAVRLIAESKTWYTPTLVVAYGGPTAEWYFYQTTNVHDDEKLQRFTPHEIIDRRTRRGQIAALDEYHFFAVAKHAARMFKAGGHVTLGAHGEEQGICAHWELWALQMGGLSNHEALQTATSLAAAGLGMQDNLGSIAPGKFADLVVLGKSPLADIRNSNTAVLVMKNGELFDANTLQMIWPQNSPLKPFKYREYGPPVKISTEAR